MTKYSKNMEGTSEFTRPNFVGRDLSNVRNRKDHKKIQYSTDFTKGQRMRLTHVQQDGGYETENQISPATIDKDLFKFGGSQAEFAQSESGTYTRTYKPTPKGSRVTTKRFATLANTNQKEFKTTRAKSLAPKNQLEKDKMDHTCFI